MEKKYILALDEGTTSARSILFDRDCNIISMSQHEIPLTYPQPGWVEQDPMAIYANQYASLTECIAKSGIPTSTVFTGSNADAIEPKVPPPVTSERFTNF